MGNKNYVNIIYNLKDRPKTLYPNQLISYLIKRFKIKKKYKILDSGCGRGDFALAFAEAGLDVTGIDYTDNLGNEKLFSRLGGINLEEDSLPFKDNSFDIVFSKSVLEHIHKPEKYLSEIYRVLKPGGKLILLVPDWQTQMYIFYDDYSHVQPYTRRGIEDTLKIFGFEDVSAEIFYQLPIVWKYPEMKIVCSFLQFIGGPVKKLSKNKFYRFSRELMILGIGRKSMK